MRSRMMKDESLWLVLEDMERGHFAVQRPDAPQEFFDRNGVALAPPPPPRILFAGIPASHLATELKSVLAELKQLREQFAAGKHAALLDVRKEVDRLIASTAHQQQEAAGHEQ